MRFFLQILKYFFILLALTQVVLLIITFVYNPNIKLELIEMLSLVIVLRWIFDIHEYQKEVAAEC